MDLAAKRAAVDAEIARLRDLRDRALKSADQATLELARHDGMLDVLNELQKAGDGQS